MPQASPSPHFCGHGVSLNCVQEVGGAEDMAEDGAGQTEELKLRYFHIVFNKTCSYLFHPCERCNEIRCRFLKRKVALVLGCSSLQQDVYWHSFNMLDDNIGERA